MFSDITDLGQMVFDIFWSCGKENKTAQFVLISSTFNGTQCKMFVYIIIHEYISTYGPPTYWTLLTTPISLVKVLSDKGLE